MPSREEILRFLASAQGKVGKREIAKAFGIKGGDRIELKALLAEMNADGELVGNRKAMKRHGQVPPVAVLEIIDRDDEGELVAEPVDLEVSYAAALGPRQDAYERLLDDAMDGDAQRFGRADALEQQWRIVSDVLDHHEAVHLYGAGTWGPAEADRLAADVGGWLEPSQPVDPC